MGSGGDSGRGDSVGIAVGAAVACCVGVAATVAVGAAVGVGGGAVAVGGGSVGATVGDGSVGAMVGGCWIGVGGDMVGEAVASQAVMAASRINRHRKGIVFNRLTLTLALSLKGEGIWVVTLSSGALVSHPPPRSAVQ